MSRKRSKFNKKIPKYYAVAIRTVTVRRLENSIRTDIEIFQYFKGTIDDINVIPL